MLYLHNSPHVLFLFLALGLAETYNLIACSGWVLLDAFHWLLNCKER